MWFRLDDQAAFHEKVLAAGNEAFGAWCRLGTWCSAQLTDGVASMTVALQIAPKKIWERLIAVRLLDELPCHDSVRIFQIHDFLDWNPSATDIRAERDRKAKNKADSRMRHRGVTGDTSVTGRDVTGDTSTPVTGVSPRPTRARSPIPYPSHPVPIPYPEEIATSSPSQPETPRKRSCQIPEGFAPNAGHRSLALELGVSLESELPKFVDYHTAKGSVMKEWNAALRTWLRNAQRFGARPNGAGTDLKARQQRALAEIMAEET